MFGRNWLFRQAWIAKAVASWFVVGNGGLPRRDAELVGKILRIHAEWKNIAVGGRSPLKLETYPKRRQSVPNDSMKNKRRIGRGLRSLLAAAFAAQVSAEPVILYDGNLNSSPEDQGWIYRLEPPIRNQSRQAPVDRAFNLNTSRNLADRAGYFVRLPPMNSHPQAPEVLNRRQGYRIGFTLRVLSERRSAPNQEAGFSLIALSHDLLGIDLGFGTGEIFARTSEWKRAEENRALPFRIDKEYRDFELDIRENEYRLSANGQEILVGSLRNYSDAGQPYTVPNLLFFGDNAESAGASVNLRRFWIDPEPSKSVPQPGEPNPLPPVEPEPPLAGDSVVFSVLEEESILSLSGTALGIAIQAQEEGSLSAAYSGTLHILLADDKIQFQPGSQIDAQPSGEWEPKPGGKSGSAPADYGGIVPAGLLFGNTFAAARNIKFTLASDWIELIERNEEKMEFSASSLLFSIPADFGSVLDTATLGLFPIRRSTSIDGISGLNLPETSASLAIQGNVQTLTLPVQAEVFGRILRDDDLKLTFSGQIIARRNLLAQPARRLSIRRLPSGEVQLSWNASPGDDYLVEQSTNLRQWEAVVRADENGNSIRADGETLVWKTPTDETARYYRVIRNPLPR